MRLFKIPVESPILQMYIRRFIVFFYLLNHEDHMSTEMWWENSFKKILFLNIMILPFFSPKYARLLPKTCMTFKLQQNAAVIFFYRQAKSLQ